MQEKLEIYIVLNEKKRKITHLGNHVVSTSIVSVNKDKIIGKHSLETKLSDLVLQQST